MELEGFDVVAASEPSEVAAACDLIVTRGLTQLG